MSIIRNCDYCGGLIQDQDRLDMGGGMTGGTTIILNERDSLRTWKIKIGPVTLDGSTNTADLHVACAQKIIAQGEE